MIEDEDPSYISNFYFYKYAAHQIEKTFLKTIDKFDSEKIFLNNDLNFWLECI